MNVGSSSRAPTTRSLGIKQRKASRDHKTKGKAQSNSRANIEGQTPPAEPSCRLSLKNSYNALRKWWKSLQKWKKILILFLLFIAGAASIIAINFLPLIKDNQKTSTTTHYASNLGNNLSTTTETITSSEIIIIHFQTIKGKNIPYDYDEEFLQKYPFQAFLVMSAGEVVQSQCFATFVDFYRFGVTGLLTAAHCNNEVYNEIIIGIIYFDQDENQVVFKSINQFRIIPHPSIKNENINFNEYSHIYGKNNYDISLILSNERLPVKAIKLPRNEQIITRSYFTPQYHGQSYNNVTMIPATVIDATNCTKSYEDKNRCIKNFQETIINGHKMVGREVQICVDCGSTYLGPGHSGSSLVLFDGKEYYLKGVYSTGAQVGSNLPHLYVSPGTLEDVIKTFELKLVAAKF